MVNILALTGSFFMLEVYDRVVPSRSVPTLIGLAILAAILFSFQGILELIRGQILIRVGTSLDEALSGRVYDTVVRLPLKVGNRNDGLQSLRDLDNIRSFLSGLGPTALFDLPWMPLYLGICFAFHFWIGMTALCGAIILIGLTVVTEMRTRRPMQAATSLGMLRNGFAETSKRNAEVLTAMGMAGHLRDRWSEANRKYMASQQQASDVAGGLGAIVKVLRLMLQSAVLGVGAYLVIHQEATAGIIIAGSILSARALAPVDLAIANWKGFVAARQSWARLNNLLTMLPARGAPMSLPRPTKNIVIEKASVAPPGQQKPVVQDVSFTLKSGDGLGVIGPSASGKSSLARMLVGAWQPVRGKVSLDGATFDQWPPEAIGRDIGYLPQDVELILGTVAQNIARFDPDADSKIIIAAAQAAWRARTYSRSERRVRHRHRRTRHIAVGGTTTTDSVGPCALRRPLPRCSRRTEFKSRQRWRTRAHKRHSWHPQSRRHRDRRRTPPQRACSRRPRFGYESGTSPGVWPKG